MTASHELDQFRSIIAPALPRARVTLDPEGWPLVAGVYGRLEWRGQEPTGARRVGRRFTTEWQNVRDRVSACYR